MNTSRNNNEFQNLPNCSFAVLSQGGQQWIAGIVYIRNLLKALSLLANEEKPRVQLLLGPRTSGDQYSNLIDDNLEIHRYAYRRNHPFWKKCCSRVLGAARGEFPPSMERLLQDMNPKPGLLFPANFVSSQDFPIPRVSWIPDFQHKRLPHFFPARESEKRDRVFAQRIANTEHTIVSSRDAYNDLMEFFPIDRDKVSILPFVGLPEKDSCDQEPGQLLIEMGLPAKFLMFPSQFWAHKNHSLLLEVLWKLKKRGMNDIALVCTGQTHDYRRPGYFDDLCHLIREKNLETNVFILGLLPRDLQVQLLRCAAAVVQPSLFEGWSAIVEDAMALGKRIYLSDIPVHREQEPPWAVFFDPHNGDELVECLAADWPYLEPGPHIQDELESEKRQHERALHFAHSFCRISQKVIDRFKDHTAEA